MKKIFLLLVLFLFGIGTFVFGGCKYLSHGIKVIDNSGKLVCKDCQGLGPNGGDDRDFETFSMANYVACNYKKMNEIHIIPPTPMEYYDDGVWRPVDSMCAHMHERKLETKSNGWFKVPTVKLVDMKLLDYTGLIRPASNSDEDSQQTVATVHHAKSPAASATVPVAAVPDATAYDAPPASEEVEMHSVGHDANAAATVPVAAVPDATAYDAPPAVAAPSDSEKQFDFVSEEGL